MASNPWEKEAEKHETDFSDIRDLKFQDDYDHVIRILPAKEENEIPFHGYTIHWIPQANSKKGRPIVHSIDKRCVVCDEVREYWTEINRLKEEEDMTDKSPEVKKIYDLIQQIKGRQRYDMNVLDRDDMHGKDDDGKKVILPKRMSAVSNVWNGIFKYAKKWGSPSNEKTGYDFTITTEGEGMRRKYSVMPERDQSPLNKEELASIEHCYDLKRLRKPTSSDDIESVLEGAKAPFDDIINRLKDYADDEDTKEETKKEEEKTETKEESKRESKKEEKKEEPVEETKEEAKEDKEEQQENSNEETKEEKESKKEDANEETNDDEDDKKEESNDEDEENLNTYECKGEFDKDDIGCKECPAKEDCKKFQPIYEKAVKLEIDVNDKRTVEEITKDVEAKEGSEEEKEEKPKRGKRGKKKLPF